MSIDANLLRRLTASRWLIPILAEMHRVPGSRFGVLVRRLGVSRSMLAANLDRLEREDWIVRNPGHGHPLRPEYLLTTEGRSMAAWSSASVEALENAAIRPAELGRWALPVLGALAGGADRFGALAIELRPITPRALSMALDQVGTLGLLDRVAEQSRHPRYALTDRGAALARRLGVAHTI